MTAHLVTLREGGRGAVELDRALELGEAPRASSWRRSWRVCHGRPDRARSRGGARTSTPRRDRGRGDRHALYAAAALARRTRRGGPRRAGPRPLARRARQASWPASIGLPAAPRRAAAGRAPTGQDARGARARGGGAEPERWRAAAGCVGRARRAASGRGALQAGRATLQSRGERGEARAASARRPSPPSSGAGRDIEALARGPGSRSPALRRRRRRRPAISSA